MSEVWSKIISCFHVKYSLFLSDFNEAWNFLDRFSENTQISNFVKIRPVGAELFDTDEEQTDSQMGRQT